jgi:hypothetical protein
VGLRAQDHVLQGSGDAETEQGGRNYDQGRIAVLLGLCLSLPMAGDLPAAEQARVRVGPAAFRVKLAQTQEERRRGLMFRRHLPADQWILFVQPPDLA